MSCLMYAWAHILTQMIAIYLIIYYSIKCIEPFHVLTEKKCLQFTV